MPGSPENHGPTGPLERRVQRLTAAVVALSVGFALAVLWALAPRSSLESGRFVLRDAYGNWRGGLVMDPEGNPTLRLNDVRARAIVYGVVQPDGRARLRIADTTGLSRVVMEVYANGEPHVRLLDASGHTGANAWLELDGRPVVDVRWGSAYRRITLPDSTAAKGADTAWRRGR